MKNTTAGAILNVVAIDDTLAYDFAPSDSYVALTNIPVLADSVGGTTLQLPDDASDGDVFAFCDVDGSCSQLAPIAVLAGTGQTLQGGADEQIWTQEFSCVQFVFSEEDRSWMTLGTLGGAILAPAEPELTFNAAAVPLTGTGVTTIVDVTFKPLLTGIVLVRMVGAVTGDGTAATFTPGFRRGGTGVNDFAGPALTIPATAGYTAAFACEMEYGSPQVGAPAALPIGEDIELDATGTASAANHLTVPIKGCSFTTQEVIL